MTQYEFNLLVQQEGFSPKMYLDSVGVTTIGIGTNLDQGITIDQASLLAHCELSANRLRLDGFVWFLGLSSARQGVIENMAYNIGVDGVLEFREMISAINLKDYANASLQMLNSKWAGQVHSRALLLAQIMNTGVFSAELLAAKS